MSGVTEHPAKLRPSVGVPRGNSRLRLGSWLQLYGVFAIGLYLLTTSRWGSYLPFGRPPYIADIVLGLVVVRQVLFGAARDGTKTHDGTPLRLAAAALVFWCVVEFARGSYSLTAIRDFAPYFYAVAILVVAVPAGHAATNMGRWIDRSMIFHGAWITLIIVSPSVYTHLPSLAGTNLLEPRPDFDGVVCAVFAAYCFHRALSGRAVVVNVGCSLWNVVLTLYLREKAGLLGLMVALAVVAWLRTERKRSSQATRARAVLPLLILLLPVLYLVGSETPTYQRFAASVHTVVPFVHANSSYADGTGTTSARSKAWGQIIRWQNSSFDRETIGVGFGPNFMTESGASGAAYLNVGSNVRSPHNYFIGTWARLGLVGLGIVSAIMTSGLWLAVLLRRTAQYLTDVDVFALLLIVGIPAGAAVGVILESPFGAIPYFWALGHLSARVARLRSERSQVNSPQAFRRVSTKS